MSNKKQLKIYFGEIMREFFSVGTPKFYKVNISNPKTLLEELINYINITQKGNYIQYDHIKKIIEEYLYRCEKDEIFKSCLSFYLDFNNFLKNSIKLESYKQEQLSIFLDELKNRLNPILRILRKKYLIDCKKQLLDILGKNEENIKPGDFTKLKKIAYSFSTEILRNGYSRFYINDNIYKYLINDENKENQFLELFNSKINNFDIYFKIITKNNDIIKIFKDNFGEGNIFQGEFPIHIGVQFYKDKKIIGQFFSKNENIDDKSFWLKINRDGLDYGVTSKKIVGEINNILDEIRFEYIYENIILFHHAVTINSEKNNDINFINIFDSVHVQRNKSSIKFFNSKNLQVKKIYESEYIDNNTKEKIKTLFRYYRYFLEATSIEHKFLNLWIGLEHIFSLDFKKESLTWKNIQLYYPFIGSINHIDDILKDMIKVQFNRKTKNNNLSNLLGNDNKFLTSNLFLILKNKKSSGFNNLINLDFLQNDDLTKVKLYRLHEKFKSVLTFVGNSRNKILWDLYRLYRIRNAIVHRGNIELLELPIDILTQDLENYYKQLLDFLLDRFSATDRFENIEQLFISLNLTFDKYIKSEGLSKITEINEIKNKIITVPLTY